MVLGANCWPPPDQWGAPCKRWPPAHMINIEVTEDGHINLANAKQLKALTERPGVLPRVDETHVPSGSHQDRIPLPHITLGDAPVIRNTSLENDSGRKKSRH